MPSPTPTHWRLPLCATGGGLRILPEWRPAWLVGLYACPASQQTDKHNRTYIGQICWAPCGRNGWRQWESLNEGFELIYNASDEDDEEDAMGAHNKDGRTRRCLVVLFLLLLMLMLLADFRLKI